MNTNIFQFLKVSEGRYLSPEEEALYSDYFSQLPQRLAYYEELQSKENAIIDKTLKTFYTSDVHMAELPQANTKGKRDMAYLYRAVALAMVQKDPLACAEKVSFIFDIFKGLGFPDKSIDHAYQLLRDILSQELSQEALESSEPYFNILSIDNINAYKELQASISLLSQALLLRMYEVCPDLKNLNQDEHCLKDIKSILNSCMASVLIQNAEPLEERKQWLFAYFKTLRFDMQNVYQTYEVLPQLLKEHLSATSSALFSPYIHYLVS